MKKGPPDFSYQDLSSKKSIQGLENSTTSSSTFATSNITLILPKSSFLHFFAKQTPCESQEDEIFDPMQTQISKDAASRFPHCNFQKPLGTH